MSDTKSQSLKGQLRAFLNTGKVKGDAKPTFEGNLTLPGSDMDRPLTLWVRQTKSGGVMLTGRAGQPKGSALEQIVGLIGGKGTMAPELVVGESAMKLKAGEVVLFENKPKDGAQAPDKSKEKGAPARPDFYGWHHTGETGKGLLDVAVWAKTDANGRAYLTGSLTSPEAKQQQRADARQEPEMSG